MPEQPDPPDPRRWRPSPLVIAVLVLLGLGIVALLAMRSGDAFVAAPGGTGASGQPTDGSTTTVAAGTPTTSTPATWQTEFLSCVATRESQDEPDAVGPGGIAFGEYQITQQTWDNTTQHYGWTGLVGTNPAQATADEQDQVAMALLQWQGAEPWGGSCSP